jgi:hypothetical protein
MAKYNWPDLATTHKRLDTGGSFVHPRDTRSKIQA